MPRKRPLALGHAKVNEALASPNGDSYRYRYPTCSPRLRRWRDAEGAVLYSSLMILVVDHDPEVLDRAREILNRDRQVFLASTSQQAFEMVQRLGFSVVLVDLDMPGDGYALIQKLHDANPELLIIAISGALNASVLEATKKIGVVEVLKKPITPSWKPVVERIRARRVS